MASREGAGEMKNKTYAQKLLDPLWKSKRQEIVDRDDGQCVLCGSSARIEVHHSYYVATRQPWEYPNDSLFCLCHNCHGNLTTQHREAFTNWESAACAVIRAVSTVHKLSRK